MSNRRDIQFHYSPHNKATVLDCNFVVDHSNGNGYGVRSFKPSGRVANVFMNSTAPNAFNSPNPVAGIIKVILQDNYNRYLGGYSGFVSPVSGTPILVNSASVLTVGQAYVIVSLGTTTQAQWVALGMDSSIQAAVGVSFLAAITGVGGGTGAVELSVPAGIDHIEVVGDPNLMNNANNAAIAGAGAGMELILACYKNGVLTAPTDGTVIGLNFYLNNSAQGV